MNKTNFFFLSILFFVLIYGIYLITYKPKIISTQEIIAHVSYIKGKVLCRHFLQSEWIPLAEGDQVYQKDIVKTSPKADIVLKFIKNDNEIKLSEKTSAEIKTSAVKVNSGSIENNSKGENPFAISIGDVEVILKVRKGQNLKINKETVFEELLKSRLDILKKLASEKHFQELQAKYKNVISEENTQKSESLWRELNTIISKLQSKKQKVKISKSDDGKIKAQVSEGKISLNIAGKVGAVEVKEGHGLILDKEKGEIEEVKLLEAPRIESPANKSVIYNKLSVNVVWKEIASAVSYRAIINDGEDFRDNESDSIVISGNVHIFKNLKYGKKYSLVVSAVDKHDFKGKLSKLSFEVKEDKIPPKIEIEDITF